MFSDIHDRRSLDFLGYLEQIDLDFKFMEILHIFRTIIQYLIETLFLQSVADTNLFALGIQMYFSLWNYGWIPKHIFKGNFVLLLHIYCLQDLLDICFETNASIIKDIHSSFFDYVDFLFSFAHQQILFWRVYLFDKPLSNFELHVPCPVCNKKERSFKDF